LGEWKTTGRPEPEEYLNRHPKEVYETPIVLSMQKVIKGTLAGQLNYINKYEWLPVPESQAKNSKLLNTPSG
jgi:hypothetical protein